MGHHLGGPFFRGALGSRYRPEEECRYGRDRAKRQQKEGIGKKRAVLKTPSVDDVYTKEEQRQMLDAAKAGRWHEGIVAEAARSSP